MKKCYILDTNALIENPDCIDMFRNGEENRVLIPYSVIMELDRLKKRADLSHIISLIAARLENDTKLDIIKIPHKAYLGSETNDDDILEDIRYAHDNADCFIKGFDPVIVSNDRMFRVRLVIEGFSAQEFRDSKPFHSESQLYTGFIKESDEKITNCFYWDANGQLWFEGKEAYIDYEHNPWGVKPRTVYQNCAMELMLSHHIDAVTLQSEAGFGKTYIALACAFHLVLQKSMVTCPVSEICHETEGARNSMNNCCELITFFNHVFYATAVPESYFYSIVRFNNDSDNFSVTDHFIIGE